MSTGAPLFADKRLQQIHQAFASREKALQEHIAGLRGERDDADIKGRAIEAERERVQALAEKVQNELADATRRLQDTVHQHDVDMQAMQDRAEQQGRELQSLQAEYQQVRQQMELAGKALDMRTLELQLERDRHALHANALVARVETADRLAHACSQREGELNARLALALENHRQAWEQAHQSRDAERQLLLLQMEAARGQHAAEIGKLDALRSELQSELREERRAAAATLAGLQARDTELQARDVDLQARDAELQSLRGTHLDELQALRIAHLAALQGVQDVASNERLLAEAEHKRLLDAHAVNIAGATERLHLAQQAEHALAQQLHEASAELEVTLASLDSSQQQVEALRTGHLADMDALRSAHRAEHAQLAAQLALEAAAWRAERERLHQQSVQAADAWAAEARATETHGAAVRAGLVAQIDKVSTLERRVHDMTARRRLAVGRALARRAAMRRQQQVLAQVRHQLRTQAALAAQAHALDEELTLVRDACNVQRGLADQWRDRSAALDAERLRWAARVGQSDALAQNLDTMASGLTRGRQRRAIASYFASVRMKFVFPRDLPWAQDGEETTLNARQELPARASAPAHVDALLALPGMEFVDATYQAILGRGADPEGRAFFRDRLLEGVSKLQILREFSNSPEAQGRGLSLPGLAPALARLDARPGGWRSRVLGWLGVAAREEENELRLNRLQAGIEMNQCAQQQWSAEIERRQQAIAKRQERIESLLSNAAPDGEPPVGRRARAPLETEPVRLGPAPHKRGCTPLAAMALDERDGARA